MEQWLWADLRRTGVVLPHNSTPDRARSGSLPEDGQPRQARSQVLPIHDLPIRTDILERDAIGLNRITLLSLLSMIFSENRCPLFRIML
jgi:hypothetical protein